MPHVYNHRSSNRTETKSLVEPGRALYFTLVAQLSEDCQSAVNLTQKNKVGHPEAIEMTPSGLVLTSPGVVSEATADEKLVASSESAAVAFDTTT
jgi:hypothetical protein